jgi:hypothetical protein
MTPADELPVQHPYVDAPAGTWQSPFPTPEPTNDYTFMVVPPPPPPHEHYPTAQLAQARPAPTQARQRHDVPRSAHATYCALPTAAPVAHAAPAPISQPAPAPVRSGVPAMVPTPATDAAQGVDDPAVDAPTGVSPIAIGLMVVAAALLVWASRMAFSPALLAMSALMLAETAIALALTGTKRPTSAFVAAGAATLVALLALKGAFAGFGEMAFVASLFVLVAALPTLLLLGALEFVIRKRSAPSPATLALRAGSRERFGAAVVLLVSGFLAKDSFSAKPDAIATFCIVLFVAVSALQVVRGTGRAARG